MAILAGIDEAGYGPILGPLVVSTAAFEVPDSILAKDLHKLLKRSASSRKKHLAGRLLIADSKKAYNRRLGKKYLERTVLTALQSLGARPSNLGQLLENICPDMPARLDGYPWYRDARETPVVADAADLRIATQAFCEDLRHNRIKLLYLQSRCLDVAYYNRLVATVRNKAVVLFTATAGLIESLWENSDRAELRVIIDKQGGRNRYRAALQRTFPYMDLSILREDDKCSSYQLTLDGRKMRLSFVASADKKFLPVSLASMTSKYVRELMVERINEYFLSFNNTVKPTAGYWKDGLRFIKDLKENMPAITYDSSSLIRCR